MMKRKWTYGALLALLTALFSCVKTEPDRRLSDQPICFNQPVIQTPVKGVITGTSYPTSLSFDAWGYYSSKNSVDPSSAGVNGIEYFSDAPCTWQGTYWIPTYTYLVGAIPTTGYYYWHSDMGYMTFQALSPHHDSGDELWLSHDWNTGFQFTGYSVDDTPGSQEDLMYTHFTTPTQRSSYGVNDGVDLIFYHALSAVQFRFKEAADYTGSDAITITSVQVTHAYKTGDFAENKTPGTLNAAYSASPAWTGHSTEQSYTLYSGSKTLEWSAGAAVVASLGTTLLAIPQHLNHGDSQVSVVIGYNLGSDAKTVTATLFGQKSGGVAVNSWEMGKCYTYTVTMGREKITFTPSTDNWVHDENWIPIG